MPNRRQVHEAQVLLQEPNHVLHVDDSRLLRQVEVREYSEYLFLLQTQLDFRLGFFFLLRLRLFALQKQLRGLLHSLTHHQAEVLGVQILHWAH